MCYYLDIEVDGIAESRNVVERWHYHKRNNYNKKWYYLVERAVQNKKPELPLYKAEVVFIRYFHKTLDPDNCLSAFKPILDGLVRSKIIADDRWPNLGEIRVDQVYRPKRLGGKIRVIVRSHIESKRDQWWKEGENKSEKEIQQGERSGDRGIGQTGPK